MVSVALGSPGLLPEKVCASHQHAAMLISESSMMNQLHPLLIAFSVIVVFEWYLGHMIEVASTTEYKKPHDQADEGDHQRKRD